MKNKTILLPSLLLLISSCFTTMPEINNTFIKNRSDAEKSDLIKIQNDIITINKEIKELEKTADITKQKLSVIKKKISLLEYQKPYLEELIKLYMLTEEGEKLGKSRGELAGNEEDLKFNNEIHTFLNINVDYQNSRLDTKQAELSVKIAEQELEKSYILSKTGADIKSDETKEKKSLLKYRDVSCTTLSKNVDVDVCKIVEHYNDRVRISADKKREFDGVSTKYLEAEKNIKKSNKNYDF